MVYGQDINTLVIVGHSEMHFVTDDHYSYSRCNVREIRAIRSKSVLGCDTCIAYRDSQLTLFTVMDETIALIGNFPPYFI